MPNNLSGYQFNRTAPTMVLDFFDSFYLAFRGTNFSDIDAFLILKEFLAGKARYVYDSMALTNLTYTGVVGWCTAVN